MLQPSRALGVLGMTGFTAWWGLTAIGEPRPGETLVVSAAAGAVGSVAGQIGRNLGCRVVGIAGGADKCRHVVEELGFDACLDYREPDFASQLARTVPGGVDIYFENVGGVVREAIWPLLNVGARVPVCGLVSGYNGVSGREGRGCARSTFVADHQAFVFRALYTAITSRPTSTLSKSMYRCGSTAIGSKRLRP